MSLAFRVRFVAVLVLRFASRRPARWLFGACSVLAVGARRAASPFHTVRARGLSRPKPSRPRPGLRRRPQPLPHCEASQAALSSLPAAAQSDCRLTIRSSGRRSTACAFSNSAAPAPLNSSVRRQRVQVHLFGCRLRSAFASSRCLCFASHRAGLRVGCSALARFSRLARVERHRPSTQFVRAGCRGPSLLARGQVSGAGHNHCRIARLLKQRYRPFRRQRNRTAV